NIAHSIACVKESLSPGQAMPKIRLGHGLYTYSLSSKKGKEALKELKDNNVVLEFQITSNVRLNNLNSLENHPLKQYLKEGIACVQGTDGAALYGTNSIDEQLSLEKMLGLTSDELAKMHEAEHNIIEESQIAYSTKKAAFAKLLGNRDMEEVLLEKMQAVKITKKVGKTTARMDANRELKDQIEDITWDRLPVVLLGGSFNTENRTTKISDNAIKQLDEMLDYLNPEEVCFIIGHKLAGYEKYLLDHNDKGFKIYSFVPAAISKKEAEKIKSAEVTVRVSTESEGMGIYKSFNYEIFERRPSVVVAFDGNSAAANLIQEAKNGKGKSKIYVWNHSKNLMQKAKSLHGYVKSFGEEETITDLIKKDL
ncbi:MAG: adenosine deaminase, partial [Pseudobutyrivibrio sp.]|nr:adenosine deaminase [Pseudobutyrivibrio sp.]